MPNTIAASKIICNSCCVVCQDIQGEVPSHLLRLKVEVEQSRVEAVLQDCKTELHREIQALSYTSTSEHVVKEHRAFFMERTPLTLCEKRIRNMEDLCHKLPDNDVAYRRLDSTKKAVKEVTEQVRSTSLQLEQHPDKWKEWNDRFCELSDWLSSQRRLFNETARTSTSQEQVEAAMQAVQAGGHAREENLLWLKSRLCSLTDISSQLEIQRQQTALTKLSADFRDLFSSLCEGGGEGSSAFQLEELREDVRGALKAVLKAGKEAGEQISRILDAEDLKEAQDLFLIHQQRLKQLQALRREAELLVSHSHQLQTGEALSHSVQELEERVKEVDCQFSAKEHNLQTTMDSWQSFETERETVWSFIRETNTELRKELIFNSLDSLRREMELNKDLLLKVEDCSVRADVLLEDAVDLQLGPKNQSLVLQQAQFAREAVKDLQDHLSKNVVHLERICSLWERFNVDLKMFSSRINENQRALEAIKITSPSDLFEQHIRTVETVAEDLEERKAVLVHMEEDCKSLSRFVTPGEGESIRAGLTQMRHSLEELMENSEHLAGQLNQSSSHRQRCNDNLEQVKKTMRYLKEKLDSPASFCSSSSEAHKILQSHTEVPQAVEQLKPRLMVLRSAVRRLGEGTTLEQEVVDLQMLQGELIEKATEKQSTLESLLALWQRFEKENSFMKSWLNQNEPLCSPANELPSADKLKISMELKHVQKMQTETLSNDALLQGMVNLAFCLYPFAPEAGVQELNDDLTQLQQRYTSLKDNITHRCKLLQSQLSQLELFDEALLTLSQKSENFLSSFKSAFQVDVTNLNWAFTKLTEHESEFKAHVSLREALQERESSLVQCFTPEAQQQLQARQENCLQLLSEAECLLLLRKKGLNELQCFLEKHKAAGQAVGQLHEALQRRGSWHSPKTEDFHHLIVEVAKDVAQFEGEAVGGA
ncbi:nesprin-1-like [Nerophis ophidion]|uniref:nesprin-1-like n=1 Tax=Nerophis ophidion TaxID=159077 RepID=UPI002AE06844|nr:nesprin-1-like [Nerophis ophidion]